ncbi:Transposon Tf2-12 polyprotein [Metarhizium brunneum]|uniref:Transposon Tf2-12 polyprotein n=1 Tax=Metarhizium brunneum TaxID=500148 RepID=A0A7D5UZE7_9HYPO|nr:Transposon Tf2-12 polyprotein [Metarhizium brunneum]QLI70597.1 Transposon Tf2-12 polyprotein [Metarhizium brunneum]
MTLLFQSQYCLTRCCSTPCFAPTVPSPRPRPHDIAPPTESQPPRQRDQAYIEDTEDEGYGSGDSIRTSSSYRPPSIEDSDDEEPHPEGSVELDIPQTLTPGQDHYRTFRPNRPRFPLEPETRARMIPDRPQLKPAPVTLKAGRRRPVHQEHHAPPMPQLSVPIPPTPNGACPPDPYDRPDLSDIKMSAATNFLQFCKGGATQCMKITWPELDAIQTETPLLKLPDLPESVFHNILEKRGDHAAISQLFPSAFHDFLDDCYSQEHLRRVTDADVDKFLKGKPDLSHEDIKARLPEWLQDKITGFLPHLANELPPRRGWDHRIELTPGREPPYQKNRPLSPRELLVVRKWLDDNLSKGFIRESRARCAAPLLLAAKPGGGVRICQDYRGLNSVTIKNRYPLPLIRETLDALCHAKYYTKLDVIAAFNKLRIAEGHEWKTAFITRFGLFESLVMPFGLCNAPASFQHYINHTLYDLLDKTCTAYLDDVLVYSQTRKEHRQHVREVIDRLIEAGLQIDINKCEFETTKTKYLGLIIASDGIQMDPDKVATVTGWEKPANVRELQRFLGFANFYRRFIRDFSSICRPLNDLLRKESAWCWTERQQHAFMQLKTAFTTGPALAFFDYNRKTVLETDASDWASGGVLSQYDDDGSLRPVAYFSSKHSAAECNYEIYDKELLAIIKALEEWRPELQGNASEFEIMTDHKNLEYFTTTKVLNQRQVRWSEFLSQFNFRIIYRPGSKAVRPDALSRRSQDVPSKSDVEDDRLKQRRKTLLPRNRFDPSALADLLGDIDDTTPMAAAPVTTLTPDLERPIDDIIDQAYNNSDLAQTMLTALRDPNVKCWPKSVRREIRIAMQDCKVRGNRIYYRDRLFLPPTDEAKIQIIYRTHSSGPGGHPGRVKTLDLITRTYWWPRMSKDVEIFVKGCDLCVRTKTSRSAPPGFLQPLPVPFRAWSDISVDYITPLPDCKRFQSIYKHILVIVCRLTKMRHFVATRTLNVDELADAFVSRVYALHGAPDNIVSDRGPQFVSEFWRQLSRRLGISLKHSSAYHPETDGQTERMNSGVEQYLRAFMSFHQNDWVDWLPLAEFAANNATSDTTGVSPFFANYGFHPRLGIEPADPCPPNLSMAQRRGFYKANTVAERFERILDQLRALAQQSIDRYERNANESRTESPIYHVGQEVWLSTKYLKTNRPMKKGDDKWTGPYEILSVYPRACRLELPDRIRIFPVFHNSLLRPVSTDEDGNRIGLPGQSEINENESRNIRGRILERDDETEEVVEKWLFDSILDCRNKDGLQYLVKWKYHAPSWQPASDLKGQDDTLLEFHREHPDKPGPATWVKKPPAQPRRSLRLRRVPLPTVKGVSFAATQLVKQIGVHFR